MSYQPYQQRVIEEPEELTKKTAALDAFVMKNPAFFNVAFDEQQRLRTQLSIMQSYCVALQDRIDHFVSA